MPDEAPVSEPAVERDGAPAPSGPESAQPSSREMLGTLADAFRNDPGALKGRTPRGRAAGSAPSEDVVGGADDVRAAQRPPEESAPHGASKPDGTTGAPSRRGAAAKISEQQSEIDRLVTEREAERARVADAESRVRAQDAAREKARTAALSRIGDDREFAALANKRMRGEVLSYEDDEKLSSMLSWREHAADLWEMADRAHKTALASSVGDRVEKYGLDRETAYSAALPDLLDHAVSVTEARVRKEQANQIKELQAELRGLRTRGAAAAAPTLGGASDGSGGRMPADGAPAEEWFRYGIGQRQAGRPAPGSAAMRR